MTRLRQLLPELTHHHVSTNKVNQRSYVATDQAAIRGQEGAQGHGCSLENLQDILGVSAAQSRPFLQAETQAVPSQVLTHDPHQALLHSLSKARAAEAALTGCSLEGCQSISSPIHELPQETPLDDTFAAAMPLSALSALAGNKLKGPWFSGPITSSLLCYLAFVI